MVSHNGLVYFSFFFTDTATTETYTLSLHDALPICLRTAQRAVAADARRGNGIRRGVRRRADRKSTRLNSSHRTISYAVFCLKKKTEKITRQPLKNKTSQQHTKPG